MKKIVPALVLTVVLAALILWHVLAGGNPQLDGEVTNAALSDALVEARDARSSSETGRILFGDMHVHTTLSVDAFQQSLPLLGGEGIHPPADACDFARFCSQLDFYALTDHAEALTPRTWRMVKDSVRQCNAVGERITPDLVAFTGFEWSQTGLTPETHFGHKNVIYRHTDEDRLPARQIGAPGLVDRNFRNWRTLLINIQLPFFAYPDQQPYNDVIYHVREGMSVPECPTGVASPEIPADCREVAETPRDLFQKLDEWGHEALVIPHGTTWGFYTPREYLWDKQLAADQDDPRRQRLIEVFSGHGNAEEYRPYRPLTRTAEGLECPAPTEAFEPCCWRAGEIVRSRCDDPDSMQCAQDVQAARTNYLDAGTAGHATLPGTALAEWGNCGQCTDCFNPAFLHRPGGSVQYMLARGHFGAAETPRHVTLGFMSSSDNHASRPGTGYKELARHRMTEARGAINEEWQRRTFGLPEKTQASVKLGPEDVAAMPPFRTIWVERQASFFMTGGLVAVHAPERTREAIWDSLMRREVYGTSGDRILLWFDLLNAGAAPVPMGSELSFASTPKFRVKAAGSFEQKPGCPDSVVDALGAERVENVCASECYYPSDERRAISRIEVVRIARQMQDSESIDELIDDPWLTFPCPPGAAVCEVEFEDSAFLESSRELLYYVRAVQEPTPAVNAGGLRCDDDGKCEPCYGGYRTDWDDDCLSMNEERAWSSPIYLTPVARAEAR
ncbi:MAG: DUF3604 domain-containing protein [Myxococcales bacterium]|nr:DUF3604 domain-containing protein [Myxococcales bacterium]